MITVLVPPTIHIENSLLFHSERYVWCLGNRTHSQLQCEIKPRVSFGPQYKIPHYQRRTVRKQGSGCENAQFSQASVFMCNHDIKVPTRSNCFQGLLSLYKRSRDVLLVPSFPRAVKIPKKGLKAHQYSRKTISTSLGVNNMHN